MAEPSELETKKFRGAFRDSVTWTTPDKAISWRGAFERNGKWHKTKLPNLQIEQGGLLTGTGSDEAGSFYIEGAITIPNSVHFVKRYKTKHSVVYEGTIDQGLICGVWHRTGTEYRGQFYLEMNRPWHWSGTIVSLNDMVYRPFSLEMYADSEGVYGVGSDRIGQFVIKGTKESDTVSFVQSYHGQHEVRYLGSLLHIGEERVISGRYGTDGIEGSFHLSLVLTDGRERLRGAAHYMKKAQDMLMGGPPSKHSPKLISQTRLAGYTGPEQDRESFVTVSQRGWILHPGKCRFDHLTQDGQGSLKGHIFNLNVPIRPAWGQLTKAQKKSNPEVEDQVNFIDKYQGHAWGLHSEDLIERTSFVESNPTWPGEITTTTNENPVEGRNYVPSPQIFYSIPVKFADKNKLKTENEYNPDSFHDSPRAHQYLIDMLSTRH